MDSDVYCSHSLTRAITETAKIVLAQSLIYRATHCRIRVVDERCDWRDVKTRATLLVLCQDRR